MKRKTSQLQPAAKKTPARRPAKKASAKKASAKKAPAKKASAKKAPAKRPTARTAAAKPAAKQPMAAKRPAQRADLGAPIDGFFLRQPAALREILEELRRLVEEVVPGATSAIKWGNPFYMLDGVMMCALGAHKSHVNLILAGPPGAFDDPHQRLLGEGKTGRHLKLTSLEQLPRDEVRGWLRTAAQLAQKN